MGKILKVIAMMLIIVLSTASLGACGCSDKEKEDAAKPDDNPFKVTKVKSEAEAFYGTWTGESSKAETLYGNITITIKKDGTWIGDVTDMDLKGTWTKNEYGLDLDNTYLKCSLYFTDKGNLVLHENGINTRIVLTKQ